MSTPYIPTTYHQARSGRWEEVQHGVIVEQPVSLTVNGKVWLTFMCTPTDLQALAVGFLFNEGIIASLDEVADLRLCDNHRNVDVWLTKSVPEPQNWKRTSGCTGGFTTADLGDESPLNLNGLLLTPDEVVGLMRQLFQCQELYRQSGGVHTSALSDGSQLLVVAEDVGRHNSLDKIAGLYLLQDANIERKVVLTTGRISSEMLQKAARIGATVVISRTSPTSMSVKAAHDLGITLIGYAKRVSFNVYTHPQRIDLESIAAPITAATPQ